MKRRHADRIRLVAAGVFVAAGIGFVSMLLGRNNLDQGPGSAGRFVLAWSVMGLAFLAVWLFNSDRRKP